jgi:hypothetical protein
MSKSTYKPFKNNPLHAPHDGKIRAYESVQQNTLMYVQNGEGAPFFLSTTQECKNVKEWARHTLNTNQDKAFDDTHTGGWKLKRTW